MSIQILQDVKLNGALVFTDANVDFPANPEIGTVVLKDTALYAYIKLGGMETWYPFANKTNSYVHTQGLPATTWVINHNLGTTDVWTQIKDSNGYIVSATVDVIDADNVEIRFTAAVQGNAVIVAPDSINVPEIKASLISVGANVEINTNGVLINGSYALTSANIDAQINAAVATETTARQAADATLQAALDAETTARISADTALQTSITSNFNFEVSARQAADATLTSNLAAEVTARTAADAALQTALNNEISTRISEDNYIRSLANSAMSAAMQSVQRNEVGTPNGVVPLSPIGLIDSIYLPSYVDDVIEFFSINNFPPEGEYSKIYVETSTNKTYRWSGSTYIQITSGAVDSVNGQAGVVVLSKVDVGLGAVDNTSDLDKPISNATQSALDSKLDSTSYTASDVLAKIKTVDGSGSGLDADTIDGLHASDFTPITHVGATGSAHGVATNLVAGFMSSSDKSKLDGIASGANNYSLPVASSTVLGGIKDGAGFTIAADGTASVDYGSSANTAVQGNDARVTADQAATTASIRTLGTGALQAAAGNHTHTKADVGLGNVDNTSDANKPISTATQTALNAKQATLVSGTNIKTVNGATLLGSGNIDVGGGVNGILKCNGAGAYSAVVSGTDVKTINGNSILGSGDLTITSGASVNVSDDTATNSTFYPLFGASTSGTVSAVKVSSTKFSFNPSTGQLNATIFNATSDINAKTDIKPIENALETVKQIQGVSFAWKDTGAKSYGYIAQEIEKIVPEVVSTDEQGSKSVNYDATIAILLEAVKTLAAKVEALEK